MVLLINGQFYGQTSKKTPDYSTLTSCGANGYGL